LRDHNLDDHHFDLILRKDVLRESETATEGKAKRHHVE
jgi:hypothetical protein